MAVNRQWGSYSDICVHYLHGSAFGVQWNCGTFLLNSVAFERRQIRKAGTVEAVALCIRNEFFGLFFFEPDRRKKEDKKKQKVWKPLGLLFFIGRVFPSLISCLWNFLLTFGKVRKATRQKTETVEKEKYPNQTAKPFIFFFFSFINFFFYLFGVWGWPLLLLFTVADQEKKKLEPPFKKKEEEILFTLFQSSVGLKALRERKEKETVIKDNGMITIKQATNKKNTNARCLPTFGRPFYDYFQPFFIFSLSWSFNIWIPPPLPLFQRLGPAGLETTTKKHRVQYVILTIHTHTPLSYTLCTN